MVTYGHFLILYVLYTHAWSFVGSSLLPTNDHAVLAAPSSTTILKLRINPCLILQSFFTHHSPRLPGRQLINSLGVLLLHQRLINVSFYGSVLYEHPKPGRHQIKRLSQGTTGSGLK